MFTFRGPVEGLEVKWGSVKLSPEFQSGLTLGLQGGLRRKFWGSWQIAVWETNKFGRWLGQSFQKVGEGGGAFVIMFPRREIPFDGFRFRCIWATVILRGTSI